MYERNRHFKKLINLNIIKCSKYYHLSESSHDKV